MSRLRDLTEDLRSLVSLSMPGMAGALVNDPAYPKLQTLLRSVMDSPDLEALSAEELRALATFRITLYRAGLMEPTMGRKHVGAVWRGTAKQALLKLPVGPEVQAAMHELMAGGIG